MEQKIVGLRKLLALSIFMFGSFQAISQLDSLARNYIDTVVSKLIVDDIPRKTFQDKFMYPHRWYVKQLLMPHESDFDTTYIRSVKQRLVITLPLAKKYYGFNLDDLSAKKALKFSPNNYYQMGFNFNNIIFSFGFYPGIKFGAKANAGTTKSKDVQLTLMGRRVVTDINFQRYTGFYVLNSKEYQPEGAEKAQVFVRPDLKVFSFGVNTMFIFNYKRYSLRGSFAFTDVQKKRAGSFMAGIYHSHVIFSSMDSTLVNAPVRKGLSPSLYNITDISLITIGISAGYGYTYVYRKMVASTILNLGLGAQKTNYTTSDELGHTLSLNPSVHLNAKAALRYDDLLYFFGIMAVYDTNYTLNANMYNVETYTSKILLFFGYRFNVKQNGRKVLKLMGLVDYN